MDQMQIRLLSADETADAARVLGRGMRDNPLHVQAFGTDADHRERALSRMFAPVLRRQVRKGAVLGAFVSNELAGVAGIVPPGYCQLTFTEKLPVLPALLGGSGLQSSLRVLAWNGDWERHDVEIPHWHLGPIAVDRHRQRQGVGSALLRALCSRIDEHNSAGYLETDKPENVAFYRRFGFEVVDEHLVLGVENWFMLREAQIRP